MMAYANVSEELDDLNRALSTFQATWGAVLVGIKVEGGGRSAREVNVELIARQGTKGYEMTDSLITGVRQACYAVLSPPDAYEVAVTVRRMRK